MREGVWASWGLALLVNDLGWLVSPFKPYHLQRCDYEYLYLITRPQKNILLVKSRSHHCVLNKTQSSSRSPYSREGRPWATARRSISIEKEVSNLFLAHHSPKSNQYSISSNTIFRDDPASYHESSSIRAIYWSFFCPDLPNPALCWGGWSTNSGRGRNLVSCKRFRSRRVQAVQAFLHQ